MLGFTLSTMSAFQSRQVMAASLSPPVNTTGLHAAKPTSKTIVYPQSRLVQSTRITSSTSYNNNIVAQAEVPSGQWYYLREGNLSAGRQHCTYYHGWSYPGGPLAIAQDISYPMATYPEGTSKTDNPWHPMYCIHNISRS